MNNSLNKPLSLRAIVTELLASYNRVHRERPVSTINSCPEDIFICQRRNWLVQLLGDLYKLLAPLQTDKAICISARLVKGNVQLYIVTEKKKKDSILARLLSKKINF